jgi:hypothetical protein
LRECPIDGGTSGSGPEGGDQRLPEPIPFVEVPDFLEPLVVERCFVRINREIGPILRCVTGRLQLDNIADTNDWIDDDQLVAGPDGGQRRS